MHLRALAGRAGVTAVVGFGTGTCPLYLGQASSVCCALQHGSVPVPLCPAPSGAEAAAQHCRRLALHWLQAPGDSEQPHDLSQAPGLCHDPGVFLQG